MTDPITDDSTITTETATRRRSPFLAVGAVLWLVCFVGLAFGWYQHRQNVLGVKSKSNASEDDDGRSPKQIKLVPRKDGGFDVQEASKGADDNPWDVDGIDDFSFTDCHGQSITKQSLLGKPFIISFIFTNCRGPCPNVTLQMQELQDRLKNYDFNLVTLTVDPARDSIETLQHYGQDHHADFNRWKFLTGNQAEIYGLINRSFKMPVEEVKGADRLPGFEIIHSTNIMLVDETGRVVGKFNAQKDEDMSRLRKDLIRLAKRKTDEQDVDKPDGKQ